MHTNLAPGATAAASTPEGGATAATRVAVAGGSGYAGQELLRVLARHPSVRLTLATSSTAESAARRLPALARIWNGSLTPLDPDALAREADIVFLALPDKAAAELAPALVAAGVRVIDVSGAFRLRDAERSQAVVSGDRCGASRRGVRPDRMGTTGARRTRAWWRIPAAIRPRRCLALLPLLKAGLLVAGSDIIIDAKSGVSGAGKAPTERTHFSEVHGSLSTYGVFNHKHGAEIEQELGREVTFTPHLLPIDRGILATIYVRVAPGTTEEALATSTNARTPTRSSCGSSARPCRKSSTSRTPTSATSAGASTRPAGSFSSRSSTTWSRALPGQAVQNMNVMLGLDEQAGLL